MASATLPLARRIAWSPSTWDRAMASLALVHAAVLLASPGAVVIALLFWWNANTLSHNFVHRPFFRRRGANRLFAAYLSVLLAFPHRLWRDRHLAHHAETRARLRLSGELVTQTALVLLFWGTMAVAAPQFVLSQLLPGCVGGLLLCALHGYYEHARGTTSYYGRLYNLLFFNDGYHVEHHSQPHAHWTTLPDRTSSGRSHLRPHEDGSASAPGISAWPAPLRWLDVFGLEGLERLAIRFQGLRRFVFRTHERALRDVIGRIGARVSPDLSIRQVAIIGGGLLPRTAIILRDLMPDSHITIIDASAANLDTARSLIEKGTRSAPADRLRDGIETASTSRADVNFMHARYPEVDLEAFDLVVFPLSFDGAREDLYERPPAPIVIVHDWIWHARGTGRVVSPLLLKRVNLVLR